MVVDLKDEYRDIKIKRDLKMYFEVNENTKNWEAVKDMYCSDNIDEYRHFLLAYDLTKEEFKELLGELLATQA